jgi:hypothetical protein
MKPVRLLFVAFVGLIVAVAKTHACAWLLPDRRTWQQSLKVQRRDLFDCNCVRSHILHPALDYGRFKVGDNCTKHVFQCFDLSCFSTLVRHFPSPWTKFPNNDNSFRAKSLSNEDLVLSSSEINKIVSLEKNNPSSKGCHLIAKDAAKEMKQTKSVHGILLHYFWHWRIWMSKFGFNNYCLFCAYL